jgi:RNA polymerase sigma-70 factor (ECF subfamily)
MLGEDYWEWGPELSIHNSGTLLICNTTTNAQLPTTKNQRISSWLFASTVVEVRMRVLVATKVGVRSLSYPMPAVSVLPAPIAFTQSDAVLLERFSAGDRTALDDLFRRYRLVAYRVAYRLLGREADALDAVQDGFIKALRHLDRFRGQSSFKTWFLRIISNAALDIGRQRKRAARVPQAPTDDPPDRFGPSDLPPADTELVRADLREKIDSALAQLPEAQRQTFVLHVDGELSYREVADILGISIGTVMSRLFYARQKLKVILADQISP